MDARRQAAFRQLHRRLYRVVARQETQGKAAVPVHRFPGPHPPYDPTPEYAAKYMARDVPLPHVTQDEIDRLPPPWKEKRRHDSEFDHDAVHWNLEPSEADLHKMRAYYYANVEMIDREVGRILDALERRGRLDNSVVIFTSDHGDNTAALEGSIQPARKMRSLGMSSPSTSSGRAVRVPSAAPLAARLRPARGAGPSCRCRSCSRSP
nr:sulfatase-like hydrolase/transferase [Salipiger thiooxidans]